MGVLATDKGRCHRCSSLAYAVRMRESSPGACSNRITSTCFNARCRVFVRHEVGDVKQQVTVLRIVCPRMPVKQTESVRTHIAYLDLPEARDTRLARKFPAVDPSLK